VTIEDEICERYRHALKSWRFDKERIDEARWMAEGEERERLLEELRAKVVALPEPRESLQGFPLTPDLAKRMNEVAALDAYDAAIDRERKALQDQLLQCPCLKKHSVTVCAPKRDGQSYRSSYDKPCCVSQRATRLVACTLAKELGAAGWKVSLDDDDRYVGVTLMFGAKEQVEAFTVPPNERLWWVPALLVIGLVTFLMHLVVAGGR
jgi:hypothetical protein